MHVALMALKIGLEVAWSIWTRRIICEFDSQCAINLVKNPLYYFDVYACIIWSIKQLLGTDWEVSVVHTDRKGNMSADWLVRKGQ